MSSVKRLGLAGTVALCAAGLAAAEGTTIPKGISVELTLQDTLSTRTAKVGDTFRATVVPAIDIDDRPVLPEGTVVVGKVELVKSIRHGHLTGVIGVKFTDVLLPGAQERGIEGVLTSWRQDDRKRLVQLAPLVSTGRKIDTVFIGRSSAGRANTLVGDDLAEGYANSGLGAAEATVTAGTQITNLGSVFGAARQAIIRFQLDHEQVPTGDLDEETLRLLGVKLPKTGSDAREYEERAK